MAPALPTKQPVNIDWEYRYFEYAFPPGEMAVRVGASEHEYTLAEARLEFWQSYQKEILAELQKWLDEGWESVSEVGPASIELQHFRRSAWQNLTSDTDALGCLMIVVSIFTGLFILLMLIQYDYVEPSKFRVQMRRPRTASS